MSLPGPRKQRGWSLPQGRREGCRERFSQRNTPGKGLSTGQPPPRVRVALQQAQPRGSRFVGAMGQNSSGLRCDKVPLRKATKTRRAKTVGRPKPASATVNPPGEEGGIDESDTRGRENSFWKGKNKESSLGSRSPRELWFKDHPSGAGRSRRGCPITSSRVFPRRWCGSVRPAGQHRKVS